MDFAASIRQLRCARAVWQQGIRLKLSQNELKLFALSFLAVAKEFVKRPAMKEFEGGSHFHHSDGVSNIDRIELLIEWWHATREDRFIDLQLELAQSPVADLN